MKATILFPQMPTCSFDAVVDIVLNFFPQYFHIFLRFKAMKTCALMLITWLHIQKL